MRSEHELEVDVLRSELSKWQALEATALADHAKKPMTKAVSHRRLAHMAYVLERWANFAADSALLVAGMRRGMILRCKDLINEGIPASPQQRMSQTAARLREQEQEQERKLRQRRRQQQQQQVPEQDPRNAKARAMRHVMLQRRHHAAAAAARNDSSSSDEEGGYNSSMRGGRATSAGCDDAARRAAALRRKLILRHNQL